MSAATPVTPVTALVDTVERLSPHFVRVVFTGPELAVVGSAEPAYDQRIKLIFPAADGRLPRLSRPTPAENWYTAWLELPEEERGSLRSYSVRDWELAPDSTRLTVDFVLHLVPGATGPASTWAAQARPGDEVLIVAPWREAEYFGGIEFAPGDADDIVLAGDETAAPAIARILGDLNVTDADCRGTAFIEVPTAADVVPFPAPPGFDVRWLAREGRAFGDLLRPAVLAHSGREVGSLAQVPDVAEAGSGEELVWETPGYSALGEELTTKAPSRTPRYYWIAGESGVVTSLRRTLTRELGVDRGQVAFMGYWKQGVAMRG